MPMVQTELPGASLSGFADSNKTMWLGYPEQNEQVHLNCTDEGVIMDIIDDKGEVTGTVSLTVHELVDRLRLH